jgi:hypothetical protein
MFGLIVQDLDELRERLGRIVAALLPRLAQLARQRPLHRWLIMRARTDQKTSITKRIADAVTHAEAPGEL